ncbi:recombination repair protein 1-like isoform X2 [Paramacrobiotus metropolitanus]|nr:recombination repair protein 1-like isoform X2 [Paramacrobiotus metropolitanus]XP_055335131.1 recombination repair protein 1-like isoform X2 [Paramacrobiotus metropolitanus]XP_055335132.1 recombination repair protein 1-like isoform X2 [Paramacrobiotus metropolitanus]XP_055335133.1 recombination repair protein 1-like isoform X2 [Paramacrobiotus metropolitanus]
MESSPSVALDHGSVAVEAISSVENSASLATLPAKAAKRKRGARQAAPVTMNLRSRKYLVSVKETAESQSVQPSTSTGSTKNEAYAHTKVENASPLSHCKMEDARLAEKNVDGSAEPDDENAKGELCLHSNPENNAQSGTAEQTCLGALAENESLRGDTTDTAQNCKPCSGYTDVPLGNAGVNAVFISEDEPKDTPPEHMSVNREAPDAEDAPQIVRRLRRRSIYAPLFAKTFTNGRKKRDNDRAKSSSSDGTLSGSASPVPSGPSSGETSNELKASLSSPGRIVKRRPSLSNVNQNIRAEIAEKNCEDKPVDHSVDVGTPQSSDVAGCSVESDLLSETVPAKKIRSRRRLTISSPEVAGRVLRKRKAASPEETHNDLVVSACGPIRDFEFTGSSASLTLSSSSTDLLDHTSGPRGILKRQEHPHKHRRLAFIDESAEDRERLAQDRRVEVEANVDEAPIPHLLPLCPSTLATAQSQEAKLRVSNFRVLSWNIAGLSAFLQKNTWREINAYLPDVICLQETKIQSNELLEGLGVDVGTSCAYWHQSVVKGHAGVALLSKFKPINVLYGFPRSNGRTFSEKGHVITAEYDRMFVVNAYVPNSSMKLKNLEERLAWDVDFRGFLAELQTRKPVIVAGDLNCARLDIDLTYPTKNHKNPGFTEQERHSLAHTMDELRLIDVYRHIYPEETGAYTFWSNRSNARSKNIGWRLDYFLLSTALRESICGVKHFTTIGGSDHCPIMLYLNFP